LSHLGDVNAFSASSAKPGIIALLGEQIDYAAASLGDGWLAVVHAFRRRLAGDGCLRTALSVLSPKIVGTDALEQRDGRVVSLRQLRRLNSMLLSSRLMKFSESTPAGGCRLSQA
jgi:hypothetical protein